MTAAVECVWPVGAQLGEGPFWSAAEQAVWFVDIKGRAVHRYHEPSGGTRSWPAPSDPGFILPAQGGRLVCGLKTGLHHFDPASGDFKRFEVVEPHAPDNRLNDGYVDPDGYLWFGSMDDRESASTGALYQLTDAGCRRRDADYVITNGPACSPNGRTLYHTDTLKKEIYAFARRSDGELAAKRVFARIGESDGYPDGPIADSSGVLWTGLYGGWGLNQYSAEGELLGKLALPVANITKAAFGGADLRTLYITSAWKGLTSEQRAQQTLAGGLFRIRVDTAGLPQSTITHGL
ncbi:MAG: SMP-30/gluconolactonase/LRE family protein [Gammaproteobacteria bacterium]